MSEGAFGVWEPLPEAAEVKPDILLVPMLAFDRRGFRLGYGGGGGAGGLGGGDGGGGGGRGGDGGDDGGGAPFGGAGGAGGGAYGTSQPSIYGAHSGKPVASEGSKTTVALIP